MIDRVDLTATTTGAAGSAAGSATTGQPIRGRVRAIYVDYVSQPATTDVVIKATGPDQTILTLTNANTDGWFYPRRVIDTTAGAAAAGVYDAFAVAGNLNVTVAQGDAGSVAVTILVEC
jgi:hypothetical protein